MNYNWDWGILFREPYLGWIISGLGWTLWISLFAWIIAFSLGSVLGIFRTSSSPVLRAIGTLYVEIFRNIPLLVQLFLWYFVFPELLPDDWSRWVKRDMPAPAMTTAIIAIGLYTASRVCEQVRSGIDAVGLGQRQAGKAIGMTEVQVYRHILLPNAYRIIIPPLTSEFLTIFKQSSLALTIGVVELTAMTRQIEEYTFQGFEAFTAATIVYSLVTFTVMAIMRQVDRHTALPGTFSKGAA
ncbi:Glutamate/aspartate import permease protein GltJ (plasmid) [Pseudoseohaeicola sp. NH-UV-7]|uniref:amino acid ABC transporter permease n=1 Tax=unclassified Sulfitobacter TaxID=196795 RepID=UPI000E0C82FF|nr:amino acid ABC transporter permease [Sulfitobacter sp. JL08]AXI55108.1 glutamate ABC transporter permease [Sulfitobacter sp. JL08]